MGKTKLKVLVFSISILFLLSLTDFAKVAKVTYLASLVSNKQCKKKNLQSHFLKYGIYVPFDDILKNKHLRSNPSLIEENCSIMVPIRFEIPLIGVFVYSWKHKID